MSWAVRVDRAAIIATRKLFTYQYSWRLRRNIGKWMVDNRYTHWVRSRVAVPTGRVSAAIPVFANLNVCCQINLKLLGMRTPTSQATIPFIAAGRLDRSWLASADLRCPNRTAKTVGATLGLAQLCEPSSTRLGCHCDHSCARCRTHYHKDKTVQIKLYITRSTITSPLHPYRYF